MTMEWINIFKEDNLKRGYKYVSHLAQRIAYNLSNSASQTEVRIISCIPIDVTDLHKRIYDLETQLDKVIYEKKVAEKAAKTHANSPIPDLLWRTKLRESIDYVRSSSCKCVNVPVSVSCGDPVGVYSKKCRHKTQKDKPVKFNKRPLYKGFFKDSGMGCHGDIRKNVKKETSDDKRNEVGSDFCNFEPVQYYHVEPARDYRPLNTTPANQSFENETENTFLSSRGIQPTSEEIAPEHSYLETIPECCRLEATLAFHRREPNTEIQIDEVNKETQGKEAGSLIKAPEIRNLTTTYNWYSQEAIATPLETDLIRECSEPKINDAKSIFITECVNPHNITKQSEQESNSDSQQIATTFESLGLPNTEPKREKMVNYNSNQITQSLQIVAKNHEHKYDRHMSSFNQETQAPTIDSCSCCFFKQLTAERLQHMPHGPLRRYLYDHEQTLSSSETSDCDHLFIKNGVTYRPRNVFKRKTEHITSRKKQQDAITNSYLEGIVTKYEQSTMQSSSSRYSAPVCRDESDSCSCCAGVFCDIDLLNGRPQLEQITHSSDSSNQQYYDDKLYDLIPVKEKSKRGKNDKTEIEKGRRSLHVTGKDVIVNYHTLQQTKSNKKPKPADTSNNSNSLPTSKQNEIPRSNNTVPKNQTKKQVTANRMETLPERKTDDNECQTDIIRDGADMHESDKPEDALSQIKQTLQFVLDKFRPHLHRDLSQKDAVMQAEVCQCDGPYKMPYSSALMYNQLNPRFIHCPHPTALVYPTMPVLTPPWINDGAMFVQQKPRPHNQTNLQGKCKSGFGVARSFLQERNPPIPETNESIEDDNATPSFKDNVNSNNKTSNDNNFKTNSLKQCIDFSEQTNLPTNDLKSKELIKTIIISSTNIAKKYKNKKIYCCLSKQQRTKNLEDIDDLEVYNEIRHDPENELLRNVKYTGSTVQEVIDELNKMEEYITRSEYKIEDVSGSEASLEKPKKKFTHLFRSIKNVFKMRSKKRRIDKRMSCDNLSDNGGKGFCVSSVQLVYPAKHKFHLPYKQNRTQAYPLMIARCSYTDLHSKKYRELKQSSRNRRSRGIRL